MQVFCTKYFEILFPEGCSSGTELAHLYDEEAAKRLMNLILSDYIPAFQRVWDDLISRYGEILNTL